jgi:hypothetical protein
VRRVLALHNKKSLDLAIPLLGIYPKSHMCKKDLNTRMIMTAFLRV